MYTCRWEAFPYVGSLPICRSTSQSQQDLLTAITDDHTVGHTLHPLTTATITVAVTTKTKATKNNTMHTNNNSNIYSNSNNNNNSNSSNNNTNNNNNNTRMLSALCAYRSTYSQQDLFIAVTDHSTVGHTLQPRQYVAQPS
jgi:hypothetical protein